MSHLLVRDTFSPAEITTACLLIKLAKENSTSQGFFVYLDDEFSALYSIDSFQEWKYIPPLDCTALAVLSSKKLIRFIFDSWMGLYVLTLRKEIFAAIDCFGI